ncbi:IS2 insertion element transposase InsAB' [Escherichia coli]|nr:IS2 insertion element transposase InsAB' [Escherichia coli]
MTGWMAAAVVTLMIRMCFSVYTMLSESCPRMVIVGYGRCFADRQNLMVCLRSMPKRVYRIMRQNALLLERKPAVPPSKRAHTGRVAVKESNQRWCSDGFEFCCDNGERLRVTFALDCCDREALHWAVTTGGFNSETVQDVMLGAVERRFGNDLPSSPVEWLTDNGSCYRANETRQFAGCWDLNRRTRRCGVRRVTE